MAQILDLLTDALQKKQGLTLEGIAAKLQLHTDCILYVLSDKLHDAGTIDIAYETFCDDEQEYILLSSTMTPYQSWTVQPKPSSLQRYCLYKNFTFFNQQFVNLLLKEHELEPSK